MLYIEVLEPKETAMENNNVISETYRRDGTLATRLIKEGAKLYLFQYDKDGQVTFCQELDYSCFKPTDITYNDGCVASITRHDNFKQTRTVTQYDQTGHVTTSIELNEDDVVNFSPAGYIRSVVKHIRKYGLLTPVTEIEEIQFNDAGYIVSSTHKVKITDYLAAGKEKWLTTEAKQYYPNGKLSTHLTYKQKTKRMGNYFSENQEDEAGSYIASVMQYSESGQLQISAQLDEYDEVSFNGDKVACITRRVKKSNGDLEMQSQTTYYASGNICTVTTYQNGKVVSSITYDENGKPESSTQEGTEQYQDIFANNKNAKYEKATQKIMTKSKMTVAQAAHILGVSLNVTEKELQKAYRKLCMQWHPDCNPDNEAYATQMMQKINEAYNVMCEYIKTHTNNNQNTNQDNNEPVQNNNNPGQTAAEKAWIKLQHAIKSYEDARQTYEQAEKALQYALEKYHAAVGPEQIEKTRKLYFKAKKYMLATREKMQKAKLYMLVCEREYNMVLNSHKSRFTSKAYAYQRAA